MCLGLGKLGNEKWDIKESCNDNVENDGTSEKEGTCFVKTETVEYMTEITINKR